MLERICKVTLYTVCLVAALAWLGGCTGVTRHVPVEPPQMTTAQAARVGAAVESKLLQMLGGPYHDKALVVDLNRLARRQVEGGRILKIAIADRSAPALYPLPGDRVIMTRGLLAGVSSKAGLEAILAHAAQLADKVYREPTTHSMVEATGQLLTTEESVYDPASASIRLARLFEQAPCEGDCLSPTRHAPGVPDAAGAGGLPEAVRRLAGLQAGYELLGAAREFERSGEQGKAVAGYLQAAAATPDEPQILASLGLAYLRAGQEQPARLHLQMAVNLQPDYYRTLMGLGYLHLQQGRLGEADQALTESVRLLAMAENLFLLAEVRQKNGDSDGAMALYRLVAEADRFGKLGRTSAERLAQGGKSQ